MRPGRVRHSTSSGCRNALQNHVKAACAPPCARLLGGGPGCGIAVGITPPMGIWGADSRIAPAKKNNVAIAFLRVGVLEGDHPACCFGQAQGAVPLDHAALLVHWCWYAMLGVVVCPMACSPCCQLYYVAARLFDAHTAWALYLLSCPFHCICGWLMHTPVLRGGRSAGCGACPPWPVLAVWGMMESVGDCGVSVAVVFTFSVRV
jgi:hypothetical protein